jgi:hypothetical protein
LFDAVLSIFDAILSIFDAILSIFDAILAISSSFNGGRENIEKSIVISPDDKY